MRACVFVHFPARARADISHDFFYKKRCAKDFCKKQCTNAMKKLFHGFIGKFNQRISVLNVYVPQFSLVLFFFYIFVEFFCFMGA